MAALDALDAGGKDVAAYIFDMDETLAKYNCVEVYKVVWRAILEYMHREKGFPADVLALEIDLGWVQKGLIFDFCTGDTLKISEHGVVFQAIA